jgi:hypothetical protein
MNVLLPSSRYSGERVRGSSSALQNRRHLFAMIPAKVVGESPDVGEFRSTMTVFEAREIPIPSQRY